ncbi:MAG: 2-C-methyl-D-erythritol 4-phosphate cytidylyltransferase [Firmicutes bacterium]|nr:2-C-methyl-D-erythritol 4-phosphate cytidylyltransferase [Bacillota bacterium]
MSKAAAVIVAAGEGRRMGGPVRKQYLPLEGVPVLARTVRAFTGSILFSQIILVAPVGEVELCRDVLKPYCRMDLLHLVEGGARRQDSVLSGLVEVREENELVCIHDGVRPLVSRELIASVLEMAAGHGAAIPGIAVTDTIKELNEDNTIQSTIPRRKIRLAQTPQAFRRKLIQGAYQQASLLGIEATDDSYLLELMDYPVQVLPGDPVNLKITGPHDLVLAVAYLKGGS